MDSGNVMKWDVVYDIMLDKTLHDGKSTMQDLHTRYYIFYSHLFWCTIGASYISFSDTRTINLI